MREEEITALRLALKPFIEVGEAIPDHWNGIHELRQQIGLKKRLPTVSQYRDLVHVARAVLP